jgi:hypothetical protein
MPQDVGIGAFVLGALLLFIALLGGGFEIAGAKIPAVSKTIRVFAALLSVIFLSVGFYDRFGKPSSPSPSPSLSSIVTSTSSTSYNSTPVISTPLPNAKPLPTIVPTEVSTSTPVQTESGISPSGTFTIRAFVNDQDNHISPLYEGVKSNFTNTPKHNTYNISIKNRGPFIFDNSWCAKNRNILFGNLSNMDIVLLVNDIPINPDRLRSLTYTNPANGFECSGYIGVISFSDSQEYRLTWIFRIKEGLNDGVDEYPAGDYIEEYVISVN